MRIRVQALHVDAPAELRVAIERRLRLTLGRHAASVDRARIAIAADGRDDACRCRIRVWLRDGESLDVEERATDPKSAVTAGAWRLAHRIRRRATLSTRAGGRGLQRRTS